MEVIAQTEELQVVDKDGELIVEPLSKETVLKYRKPIFPANRLVSDWESMDACKRKWFPKKHLWKEMRNTGVYSYRQCQRCTDKQIIQLASGYQPVAIGWEDVVIKQ